MRVWHPILNIDWISERGAHTKIIPSPPIVEYHHYTWEHYSHYNNNNNWQAYDHESNESSPQADHYSLPACQSRSWHQDSCCRQHQKNFWCCLLSWLPAPALRTEAAAGACPWWQTLGSTGCSWRRLWILGPPRIWKIFVVVYFTIIFKQKNML